MLLGPHATGELATRQSKAYRRLEHGLAIGGTLPLRALVDMEPVLPRKQRRRCARRAAAASDPRQRIAAGEQSLVFNRRGYAPVLHCPTTGWKSGCPHCSAWRVHKGDRTLRCHHCGFTRRAAAPAPTAAILDIRRSAAAPSAEQIAELLPRPLHRRAPHRRRQRCRLKGLAGNQLGRCTRARSTCWWARRWSPRATTSAA